MKQFALFRLDNINECLWRRQESGDERILLTPKAFAVLRYLVEHAGRLVTQDELLDAVWRGSFVQPEVLKYQIAAIRSALGDRAKNSLFIETLARRGYQFIATVTETDRAELQPGISCVCTLAGRSRELGALRTCLRNAIHGQRQVVFVTGKPGIGKTALLDEFQRQMTAEHSRLRIARGQCVEGYGGAEAYYPVLDALGELCRGPEAKGIIDVLAAQAPTWLAQFPALLKREHRQTLQWEILGATRDRMLREIRDALDTISAEVPLALILEDSQWVDPSSVDLISAIARERSAARLMLIIAKRPVDREGPDHPVGKLNEDLLLHHLCQQIALEPLSEADVAEYLSAGAPVTRLPNGFAALMHRHSQGNPLLMIAALDRMMQGGQVSRENGVWRLTIPINEIDLAAPDTSTHCNI
jgi:DNA-binding winged helix-turn-helix (wHTH) protein